MNVSFENFKKQFDLYKSKNHAGKSLETIKNELTELFQTFNINTSNFPVSSFDTEQGSISSTTSSYIHHVAKEIFDKQQTKSGKQDFDTDDRKTQKLSRANTKKPISFDIVEISSSQPDAIRSYIANKLIKAGFSDEELLQPLEQINVLGMNDKAMDLNITPGVSILDQFVEMIYKLRGVFLLNIPAEEIKNYTMTDLISLASQTRETIINGKEVETDSQTKLEVSTGGTGSPNVENDLANKEELRELEQQGVDTSTIKTQEELDVVKEILEDEENEKESIEDSLERIISPY